jgi:glycosyltransferase involved in cell wall biosynthesis
MKDHLKQAKPLVSIIMTCFNNHNTLQDAISSIINQSYQSWELIFVDDGSTDKSLKIINEILDDRIKIFSLKKNYGRGFSYQKGLNEASGKFIMFLDSDDWWYSNKIIMQLDYLKKNKNTMFVGSGLITSENYIPIGVRSNKKFSNIINKKVIANPPIAFATICLRREMISKYSFDRNLEVAQDNDFLRTLCMNEYFSNLNDILYVYNESSSFNWSKMKNAWKNTKIGLKKYKKSFFLDYYISIIKVNLKIFIYFIFFSMKIEKLLLHLRVSAASEEDLNLYYKEKNMMLKVKSKLFKNL